MKKGSFKRFSATVLVSGILSSQIFVGSLPFLKMVGGWLDDEKEKRAIISQMDMHEETDMADPIYEVPVRDEGLVADVYGYSNVIYKDFNELDFEKLPTHHVKLPYDLKKVIFEGRTDEWNLTDPVAFEETLLDYTSWFGNPESIFYDLSPEKSIRLMVDIIDEGIRYSYVDREVDKHYFDTSRMGIDDYLYQGWGDCDKYRSLVLYGFDIMKENNPGLDNVYLYEEGLGGNFWHSHAWNSVILMFDDRIEISHFDPTWADSNPDNFEASGYHITPELFHFYVMYTLGDFGSAVEEAIRNYHLVGRKDKANLLDLVSGIYYDNDKLGRDEEAVLMFYDIFLEEGFHNVNDEDFRDAYFYMSEDVFDIYVENEDYVAAKGIFDEMVRMSEETNNYYNKRDWPKKCNKIRRKHPFLK